MIGAVVLAAGLSSRMGAFKPLLEVAGVPALARAIRCLAGSAEETVVVTGFRAGDLTDLIAREGAKALYNPDYEQGMFTSVAAGVRYFADRGAEGLLLLPGDCAAVPRQAVRELLVNAGDDFAVPGYGDKRGHPMWIPARFFEEILAHDGTDGLKPILARRGRKILPMPFPGTVADMDRPEDREALEALLDRPPLPELARGRRLFLLRHGATVLHAGKIIMGRCDAKLSPEGETQMEAAGRVLAELKPETGRIYTSPLSRARDSAAIVSRHLGLETAVREDLQELSLGAWDGLLIDEVRRRWPEAYERRGQELMAYRFDADCESFYDLEYRAGEALRRILAEDDSRDLILVTHAGVLKCLYGLLNGRDIDWAFSRFNPMKGEMTLIRG